jgi:predicted pyridoxine 5'-phosphate oxidase superfamily flavin-nucleotide-binding protein
MTGAWHAGEQALQRQAGVAQRMADIAPRFLRDHMPEQHRQFFAELPFVLTGILDDTGQPWASLLAGPPGFASSPTPQTLRIAAAPLPGDPAAAHWREGAPVGLLGLQAHTGRRNRMNGRIVAAGPEGCEIRVDQSFGNCPKYIHPREAVHAPAATQVQVHAGTVLDEAAARIVAAADTFFIASTHPEAARTDDASAGVDVSHRGGPPGFVRLQADGALHVPDYTGNSFFNTLGNLHLEPRCGLLFIDYATGERVYLACRAVLLPEHLLHMEVLRCVRVRGGLPLRWPQGVRAGPAARPVLPG